MSSPVTIVVVALGAVYSPTRSPTETETGAGIRTSASVALYKGNSSHGSPLQRRADLFYRRHHGGPLRG